MADFYRQFAFVSSVLAGFSFTFYGTLLMAAREHRAGTWAAFLAVAASVAFLPVTLGMTFTAARTANQPSEFSISNAVADPQLVLLKRKKRNQLVLSENMNKTARHTATVWQRNLVT